MIGNASLVNIYNALLGRNRWLALAVAVLAKFGVLYASVSFFATRPLELAFGGAAQKVVMPGAFVSMMSWPQLATAVAGGLLAFVFLRLRKDRLV